ncbi:MAG: putative glycosyl transferase [Frankiales bacterium]|nr:putative glycosyl transferase [Frankiales bacterium]
MTSLVVVVPAFRETSSLATLLSSLAVIPERPRVVVAVDGGHPATVETAREGGAEVVVLPTNGGSYAARNAALDLVMPDRPDVVLFTDADCVATDSWIPEHLSALADAELSGGGVTFTFRRDRPTPAEWVDACRHLNQDVYVARDGYAATCNLAVRGAVLVEARFDATLRTGGDAEFCRRVVAQSGARLVYTPKALITHPARDLRELRVKVDRLVSGIPRQAERWKDRPVPSRRLTRGMWRRAQRAGYDVGPVWGVLACVLDWSFNVRVARAVERVRSA